MGAEQAMMGKDARIMFLHHSTGQAVAKGDASRWYYKIFKKGTLANWLADYNSQHGTGYVLDTQLFPSADGYGWSNDPHDYYDIWVTHAGDQPYRGEPTLEMLTKKYDVIILKHCFPIGLIDDEKDLPETDPLTADSPRKTLTTYKLQYEALKAKMKQFPNTRFIVWTGAALVKRATTISKAERMKQFVAWVNNTWDEKGDNIFVWDFYSLETEGELYMKDEYALGPYDSHPNVAFAIKAAGRLGQRIVDVIEGRGDGGTPTN